MASSPNVSRRPGADRYAYRLALASLDFKTHRTDDAIVVGLQILDAANMRPPDQFALVAILPNGDFEEIRLKEPYDLKERGVERLIAFKTDRLHRLKLLDAQVLWGAAKIAADILYGLVKLAPDDMLFLDTPGGTDRPIEPGSMVDLEGATVENIVAGPRPKPGFEVTVVYNGQPAPVRVTATETLHQLLADALAIFGQNSGELTLFGVDGAELPLDRTVQDVGLQPGGQVLLRPRVVRGG